MSKIEKTPVAASVPFEGAGFDADNVQDGIIEAKSDAINLQRFPVSAVHNARLSDGQLVGVSNLVNVPLVIPVKSILAEVAFYQDGGSTRDGQYRFYRNSQTAPNLFFTWTLNNTTSATAQGFGVDFTSPTFFSGDLLLIYYDDTGTNHSDVVIQNFMQAQE